MYVAPLHVVPVLSRLLNRGGAVHSALNVPHVQVREGEEGCKTDAFGAVVARRRHCAPASRQAKATSLSSAGVKQIRLFTMTS